MLKFLGQRVVAAAVMVGIASTLVFYSIQLLPGDPVTLLLGEQGAANPEVVAEMRAKLNLDRPIVLQYVDWIRGMAVLDLGQSLQTGLPVSEELARRIPRSLELIFFGLLVATVVGVPIGIIGGRHPDRPSGWLASVVAVAGFASPVFVTGILLVIVFSLWLSLLPSSGYVAFAEGPWQHVTYAILPICTVAIGFVGVVIRMTRASLMDILTKDYVRTARAKGLAERLVVYRHALPNSLIPVIAVLGVRAGNLLGGTVIIENLFNWPGLSSMLVEACYARDYPMIQGALLSIFVMFVAISVFVDLCQGLIDPKLRHA